MKWWTGGSFAILACAVVVGCADEPGRPVSEPVTTNRSTASADPGVDTAPAESGTTAGPSAPGVPTTRATTAPKADETDLPGVPGSPITYDATNLAGQHPGRVRRVIEERLAPKLPPHCRANLCGITFAISTEEGDEKCFKRAAPQTVYPGGVITLFVGVGCDQPERDEPAPVEPEPEEPAPEEPAPEEPAPGEPAPGERARPTTTTVTTTGDGG